MIMLMCIFGKYISTVAREMVKIYQDPAERLVLVFVVVVVFSFGGVYVTVLAL